MTDKTPEDRAKEWPIKVSRDADLIASVASAIGMYGQCGGPIAGEGRQSRRHSTVSRKLFDA
jgi:hypothetical protein